MRYESGFTLNRQLSAKNIDWFACIRVQPVAIMCYPEGRFTDIWMANSTQLHSVTVESPEHNILASNENDSGVVPETEYAVVADESHYDHSETLFQEVDNSTWQKSTNKSEGINDNTA